MKATFENSVNVLVKAYFDNTLAHSYCCACAVGNLVANAIDDKPSMDYLERFNFKSGLATSWPYVFVTGASTRRQRISVDRYIGEAKRQIDATGYSVEQLAKIEKAFECAPGFYCAAQQSAAHARCFDETWMFNGLMAVVDVLAEIHGVDLTAKENAIGQFQKVKSEKQTA